MYRNLKRTIATLCGLVCLSACSTHTSGSHPITVEHLGDSLTILTIDRPKRFLLLPIQESSMEAQVALHSEGVPHTYMDIRLAVDSIDYYVPFELPQAHAVLHVKNLISSAIAWSEMSLADEFDTYQKDYYHPIYHHTPPYGWMNDPNGLIYKDGEYHLYYQFNPYGSRWGNMHWGHSVSKDLVHWEALPPAIKRDTLGHIFSGCTIIDEDNTAGFGKGAIIAFYTSHKEDSEKNVRQVQCMAYSLDNGRTYTKYEGNPILSPHDGIKDFRDPKVFWYAPLSSWYMIVSADTEMRFYRSKDLKEWIYVSSFGQGWGVQPNQFECPDFFELPVDGNPSNKKWVMIVNINPGCLFGGSATEYFVGDFDGQTFTPMTQPNVTKWLDWGKDHYAAVTFAGIPERILTIAWTSNWQYANVTPTRQHRGANSLPRELRLFTARDGDLYIASIIPDEMLALRQGEAETLHGEIKLSNTPTTISPLLKDNQGAMEIKMILRPQESKRISLKLKNDKEEQTVVRLDLEGGKLIMDRSRSGLVDFGFKSEPHTIENHDNRKRLSINYINDFALGTWAPLDLLDRAEEIEIHLFVDKYTIELFAGNGRIAMTNQVFPKEPYNALELRSDESAQINDLKVYRLGL